MIVKRISGNEVAEWLQTCQLNKHRPGKTPHRHAVLYSVVESCSARIGWLRYVLLAMKIVKPGKESVRASNGPRVYRKYIHIADVVVVEDFWKWSSSAWIRHSADPLVPIFLTLYFVPRAPVQSKIINAHILFFIASFSSSTG